MTSLIAGVNINESGRGFPLHTKREEERKRRRMRGGIVAGGCFSSISPFGHVHPEGKLDYFPPLPSLFLLHPSLSLSFLNL